MPWLGSLAEARYERSSRGGGGELPVVVTFVDTDEHVNRVLPKLREMALIASLCARMLSSSRELGLSRGGIPARDDGRGYTARGPAAKKSKMRSRVFQFCWPSEPCFPTASRSPPRWGAGSESRPSHVSTLPHYSGRTARSSGEAGFEASKN